MTRSGNARKLAGTAAAFFEECVRKFIRDWGHGRTAPSPLDSARGRRSRLGFWGEKQDSFGLAITDLSAPQPARCLP